MAGIGSHQQTEGINDERLTPPEIVKALGKFDLDPASPIVRPWPTADKHYTKEDDGLFLPWYGRVWLNPPYNRYQVAEWMQKMALHDNGIMLLFARTETPHFQEYVFGRAESILWIKGRLTFYDVNGELCTMTQGKNIGKTANSGAPSVLISYGEANAQALAESGIKGHHSPINSMPVIVVAVSPSWKSVVTMALVRSRGEANVQTVYDLVERIAPDKTAKNANYREKIRQQLQKHFTRIQRGIYKIENEN